MIKFNEEAIKILKQLYEEIDEALKKEEFDDQD